MYEELDRGDGICKYFDIELRLCMIYEDRPQKCNIDKTYEIYFKEKISREQYYQLNYEVCDKLKKEEEEKRGGGKICIQEEI